MYFILSPCGTSLLTNQARLEEKQIIFKNANAKSYEEIPEEDRPIIDGVVDRVREAVNKADIIQAAQLSAELNGIIHFYDGQLPNRNDYHFLLSTDTYLGSMTANLVKQWLEAKNRKFVVEVFRQTDLRTVDIMSFQLALSDLVKHLSYVVPEFSQKGYKVIFNLTGGFKSIQGFLQSIANFYAHESVYIFETSSDLLRIPKLPMRLDALQVIRENLRTFRRLSLGLPVKDKEVQNIPETLLLKIDGEITFSPWGALIWEDAKKELYRDAVYASPDESKLVFGKEFEKSAQALPPERKVIVNERIDQLILHLYDNNYNPPSLDFKELKGKPFKDSTHELDAWGDLDAKRIFGHFEGGKFVLDRLDKGLH